MFVIVPDHRLLLILNKYCLSTRNVFTGLLSSGIHGFSVVTLAESLETIIGFDILKRMDGCPCIRHIILSESHSSWRSVRQGRCILSLWGSEDRERRLFIDTAVDCYWMLACTKVSEKQRARTGEHSPYSLLLRLMDRKLQTGAAMFCLCLLHTKGPKDNLSLEPKRREIRILSKDKSLKHATRKLDHIGDSIHTSVRFYCLNQTWVWFFHLPLHPLVCFNIVLSGLVHH